MTQSVIGALRVNLGLDSAQFERGAKNVSAPLNRMRSQFKQVAAAAAAFGVALAALTVRVAGNANEIRRLSQVAGADVAVFQKWAAASATVGVQQEKLSDILKDVNDRVGDFLATGAGPMADFFEKIAPKVGVTAEQFRNLSGPQALQLYVDSLEKAGANQQEMTFYLEAMASDLTLLLPLLRDGGAEMGRLGERARAFGAVMDRDAIESLSEMKIALAEVGLVFDGMRNKIAAQVAPAITFLSQAFTDSAASGGRLRQAIDFLVENIQRMATWLAVAVAAFGTRFVAALVAARLATFSLSGALVFLRGALIRTGIGALVVGAGELVFQFTKLVRATGGWGEALSLLGDVARGVWEGIKTSATSIVPALGAVWSDIQSGFLSMLATLQERWSDFLRTIANELRVTPGFENIGEDLFTSSIMARSGSYTTADAARQAEERAAAQREEASNRLSSGFEGAAAAARKLREAVSGVSDETDGAAEAAARLNAGVSELDPSSGSGGQATSKYKDLLTDIAARVTEMENATRSSAEAMRDGFADAFTEIVTGAESAQKAISSLLNSIGSGLIRKAGQFLGGQIGSALGIPGFASGTNFAPGGLAWVGEKGPELVNLPRGSQVFNAQQSRGMAGGVNFAPVFNIDARGAVEGTATLVRGEIARLIPEMQRAAVSSVKGAGRRGY